jgi:hypothetical protein
MGMAFCQDVIVVLTKPFYIFISLSTESRMIILLKSVIYIIVDMHGIDIREIRRETGNIY